MRIRCGTFRLRKGLEAPGARCAGATGPLGEDMVARLEVTVQVQDSLLPSSLLFPVSLTSGNFSPASFVAEGIWLKVMDCSPAVKGTQTVGEGAKTIRGDIGNVLCDVCGRCFRCCWPGSKPGTCQRPPRQCTGRGQAYCSTCVVSCWSQVSGKDEALMT